MLSWTSRKMISGASWMCRSGSLCWSHRSFLALFVLLIKHCMIVLSPFFELLWVDESIIFDYLLHFWRFALFLWSLVEMCPAQCVRTAVYFLAVRMFWQNWFWYGVFLCALFIVLVIFGCDFDILYPWLIFWMVTVGLMWWCVCW